MNVFSYIKKQIVITLIVLLGSGVGGAVGWTWATRNDYITKVEASDIITLRVESLKDYLGFFEGRLSSKLSSIDNAISFLDEKRETRLNKLEEKIEVKLEKFEKMLKKRMSDLESGSSNDNDIQ